ncbi:MAG: hypothetical protein DMF79_10180, partial [Acidobacteria bacterium]
MPVPATVMPRLAREASEATWSGQAVVTALRTSPLRRDETLPVIRVASRESPGPPSAPVLARVVVLPPKRPKVVALTALALPTTVCAAPVVGQASAPAIAVAT